MSPSVSVMMPVLVNEPWQLAMTQCAIKTLRCTTDHQFELVIAHAPTEYTDLIAEIGDIVREKVIPTVTGTPNADCNKGLDACTGDIVVYTGNDVFVRPGWLEALLECFEIEDCGAATLGNAELKHVPMPRIMEGVYGPFMAFRQDWRFDAETFPCQFGDTDLIMRIYESGKRMYRNHKVVIHHLLRQTVGGEANDKDFLAARDRFIRKHGDSNLLMYRALSEGWGI